MKLKKKRLKRLKSKCKKLKPVRKVKSIFGVSLATFVISTTALAREPLKASDTSSQLREADQYCKDIDQYFEINTDNEQLNSNASELTVRLGHGKLLGVRSNIQDQELTIKQNERFVRDLNLTPQTRKALEISGGDGSKFSAGSKAKGAAARAAAQKRSTIKPGVAEAYSTSVSPSVGYCRNVRLFDHQPEQSCQGLEPFQGSGLKGLSANTNESENNENLPPAKGSFSIRYKSQNQSQDQSQDQNQNTEETYDYVNVPKRGPTKWMSEEERETSLVRPAKEVREHMEQKYRQKLVDTVQQPDETILAMDIHQNQAESTVFVKDLKEQNSDPSIPNGKFCVVKNNKSGKIEVATTL